MKKAVDIGYPLLINRVRCLFSLSDMAVIKNIFSDLNKDTIFYGAGNNCREMLGTLIDMNIIFEFRIWDKNAPSIKTVFDKQVTLPDFETKARHGQIMIITIENIKIANIVRNEFEKIGYKVYIGIKQLILDNVIKSTKLCPICKSNDIITLGYDILKCNVCSHGWRVNVPDVEETIELKYKTAGYWSQDKNHQGITHIEFSDEWNEWLNDRIPMLESFDLLTNEKPNSFSIFEFGCSEGMLLYALKQRGFDVLGNEVCQITDESQKVLGITILSDPIETLQIDKHFDLIMSFHVMEHLVDPAFVLEKLCKLAKPNGKIFLRIPIDDGEYSNLDHYHFFSSKSLRYLMNRYTSVLREDVKTYKTANGDVFEEMSILGQLK